MGEQIREQVGEGEAVTARGAVARAFLLCNRMASGLARKMTGEGATLMRVGSGIAPEAAWSVAMTTSPMSVAVGSCRTVCIALRDASGKGTPRNYAGGAGGCW